MGSLVVGIVWLTYLEDQWCCTTKIQACKPAIPYSLKRKIKINSIMYKCAFILKYKLKQQLLAIHKTCYLIFIKNFRSLDFEIATLFSCDVNSVTLKLQWSLEGGTLRLWCIEITGCHHIQWCWKSPKKVISQVAFCM